VQFLIDKQVASGSAIFSPTNMLNGPQWVTTFTNAVQKGEVAWWDANKKFSKKESSVHGGREE
jgi:hypothetical protein